MFQTKLPNGMCWVFKAPCFHILWSLSTSTQSRWDRFSIPITCLELWLEELKAALRTSPQVRNPSNTLVGGTVESRFKRGRSFVLWLPRCVAIFTGFRLNIPRLNLLSSPEKRQPGKAPNYSVNWTTGLQDDQLEIIDAMKGKEQVQLFNGLWQWHMNLTGHNG